MKIGSLCTGYGGLDLAVEQVFNAHTVWYSEFDKHVSKIMEQHRPDLPNLGDLTKTDWSKVESIDILTAGYPCQPFSGAGQRKGTNDPRHIWPSIAEALRILKPSYIILENVRGHLSLGFGDVLRDLYYLGYDARWQIVRASDIGAAHQRARLFIVAYPKSSRWRSQQNRQRSSDSTKGNGLGPVNKSDSCITPNPYGNAHAQPRRADSSIRGTSSEIINGSDRKIDWGRYQDAITRWERLTRPAPIPITDQRLEPKFVEWMMGLPDGWVTDTPLSRSQQLKALGNGVVPQQAIYAISQLISDTR